MLLLYLVHLGCVLQRSSFNTRLCQYVCIYRQRSHNGLCWNQKKCWFHSNLSLSRECGYNKHPRVTSLFWFWFVSSEPHIMDTNNKCTLFFWIATVNSENVRKLSLISARANVLCSWPHPSPPEDWTSNTSSMWWTLICPAASTNMCIALVEPGAVETSDEPCPSLTQSPTLHWLAL